MTDQLTEVKFKVIEKGEQVYILWPWTTPESFLYEALNWGATYKIRRPVQKGREAWLEFAANEGTYGEYHHNLFFGMTAWGHHIYRRFGRRQSHYLTQHGLDGLPRALWEAAYEYLSGEPIGNVRISFGVSSKKGAFTMTFKDWVDYFVSGRNRDISDLGISIKKK